MDDEIDTLVGDCLERAARAVPESAAPVGRLLEQGRRARRRRIALVAAAAAGVVVIAGAAVAITAAGVDHGSAPVAQQALPQPPDETRWVGIGRTVFAIPDDAPMQPGLYCPDVRGQDYVTIVAPHVVVSCPMIRGTEPPGQLISLSADGGTVSVSGASAEVEQSRTTLPEGWLAVPAGVSGDHVGNLTADDEARALTKAGFQVARKTGPAEMTQTVTTRPAIGEPARVGSTVTVIERPR